jgi:hypothetical protein
LLRSGLFCDGLIFTDKVEFSTMGGPCPELKAPALPPGTVIYIGLIAVIPACIDGEDSISSCTLPPSMKVGGI